MKTLSEKLIKMKACKEAILFCENKTLEQAWNKCKRGDWMLWLAFKMKRKRGWSNIKQITLAKVRCARLVQHLMKDQRSLDALDVAEKYALGKATRKELNDAATYAAYVAADTIDAADVVTYAENIKLKILKQCADICHETLRTGELN